MPEKQIFLQGKTVSLAKLIKMGLDTPHSQSNHLEMYTIG